MGVSGGPPCATLRQSSRTYSGGLDAHPPVAPRMPTTVVNNSGACLHDSPGPAPVPPAPGRRTARLRRHGCRSDRLAGDLQRSSRDQRLARLLGHHRRAAALNLLGLLRCRPAVALCGSSHEPAIGPATSRRKVRQVFRFRPLPARRRCSSAISVGLAVVHAELAMRAGADRLPANGCKLGKRRGGPRPCDQSRRRPSRDGVRHRPCGGPAHRPAVRCRTVRPLGPRLPPPAVRPRQPGVTGATRQPRSACSGARH